MGFNGGKPVQLTHLNQAVLEQRKFGEYQQFSFPGWNDENVFGYVVKPVDFKADRKYPGGFPDSRRPAGQFWQCLELALESQKHSRAQATA